MRINNIGMCWRKVDFNISLTTSLYGFVHAFHCLIVKFLRDGEREARRNEHNSWQKVFFGVFCLFHNDIEEGKVKGTLNNPIHATTFHSLSKHKSHTHATQIAGREHLRRWQNEEWLIIFIAKASHK